MLQDAKNHEQETAIMDEQGEGEIPAGDEDREPVPSEIGEEIPEVPYDSITERVMLFAG